MLFSHKTGSTGTCCRADGLSEGSQTARCRASGSSDPECQEGADLWGKRAQRWPGAEGREAQGAHLRVSVSFQGEDVPELDRCVGCMTVKVQIHWIGHFQWLILGYVSFTSVEEQINKWMERFPTRLAYLEDRACFCPCRSHAVSSGPILIVSEIPAPPGGKTAEFDLGSGTHARGQCRH